MRPQENVALVVVYSALMALAWRETVPDTVPFARLCDVMLTALQKPIRKCIKIPTASFTVQFRVWVWSRPRVARDCLFQGRKEEARFRPHSRRPAACSNDGLIARFTQPCSRQRSIHRMCLTMDWDIINGRQTSCLIAIALPLGTLQALLTRTAVTILHSSTMHQHPTPALTASNHQLCTPSGRRCGVVQHSPLNGCQLQRALLASGLSKPYRYLE
jgi:hypothetical protein